MKEDTMIRMFHKDENLYFAYLIQKSERAGPHPIGQKGQLVKSSLDPKS